MSSHKPIKILKVRDEEVINKLPREIPSYLPQMKGEVILIVAPIAQGKSNFISNYFLQEELARGMFDTIYFFSNTARQDSTSRFLINEPNVIVYDTLNDNLVDNAIQDIIDYQSEFEKKDMPRIAVVMDDLTSSLSSRSKAFALSSRARHYNIANLFFVVQKYKSVPAIVRNCITHLICFAGIFNSFEIKSLGEEYDSVGGNEGFGAIYKKYVQKNKYNFLYANLTTGKTYLNFDKLLHSNFDDTLTFSKDNE